MTVFPSAFPFISCAASMNGLKRTLPLSRTPSHGRFSQLSLFRQTVDLTNTAVIKLRSGSGSYTMGVFFPSLQ